MIYKEEKKGRVKERKGQRREGGKKESRKRREGEGRGKRRK